MTAQTVKIEGATILWFSTKSWGNRKKVASDNKMLQKTKKLIDPEGALQEIYSFQESVVKKWLKQRSVPTYWMKGTYWFKLDQVDTVRAFLKEQSGVLTEKVEALLDVYPQKIREAEKLLGPTLFKKREYPTANQLREKFRFEYGWINFDVDKRLSKEAFEEEKAKQSQRWTEATEMVTYSLRAGFEKLIDHAVEILKKKGSDGKQYGWRDSSFQNITEFINLFNLRNITNDAQLEQLVLKAKSIMEEIGDDPQELKKDKDLRKSVVKQFAEVAKELDVMVAEKPRRMFSFDD